MRLPFISLVFSLLAVAAVLLCSLLEQPWLALAPLGLIVVYIGIAFWMSGGDGETLEWFGDHVYFLGYVSTITAFAGVVLRAWILNQSFEDPRPVLLMGGVALLTTVAGLVGMTFLRACARAFETYDTPAAERPGRRAQAPRPVPAAPAAGVAPGGAAAALALVAVDSGGVGAEELRDVTGQATRAIEQLSARLALLNDGIGRLHQIVSQSNPEVETLIRNVSEVQSVLDGFVAYLGSKLESDGLRSVADQR